MRIAPFCRAQISTDTLREWPRQKPIHHLVRDLHGTLLLLVTLPQIPAPPARQPISQSRTGDRYPSPNGEFPALVLAASWRHLLPYLSELAHHVSIACNTLSRETLAGPAYGGIAV